MQSVEKVNLSGSNEIRFMTQPENSSEAKESSVKKYLTAPNVILGSLATIGVLGMADVLICKGKHLNKITGKGKELEDALSKATAAESRAAAAEAKITTSEAEALKAKKQLNDLIAQLKKTTGLEGELKVTGEGANINLRNESNNKVFWFGDMITAPLHMSNSGKESLEFLQRQLTDLDPTIETEKILKNDIIRLLKRLGYDVCEDIKKFEELGDAFEHNFANVSECMVTRPAILHKGKLILTGYAVFPK